MANLHCGNDRIRHVPTIAIFLEEELLFAPKKKGKKFHLAKRVLMFPPNGMQSTCISPSTRLIPPPSSWERTNYSLQIPRQGF